MDFFLVLTTTFLPLIIPPIYSRRGYLSVGRWLIMAIFVLVWLIVASLGLSESTGPDSQFWGALVVPLCFAFPGCLLAAAIYPKNKVKG